MPAGEFLAGMALLFLGLSAAGVFAVVLVRRQLPRLTGAPRILAWALFATLGFIAVHLVPGALGILGKGSVAVSSVLLVVAVLLLPARQTPARPPAFPPPPQSDRLSGVFAGVAVGLFALYAFAHGIDHGDVATRSVDMTSFHLPPVARWIQTGSLWGVHDFVPHRAFGAYPHTSDLITLGAVLPFDSDFLVRFINYPALAMAGLGTYALGRELAAPAAGATLFATALVAMPAVTEIAFDGLADTLMLATFATGLAFLIRQRRTGARSDVVVAGLALGICFGTKWYAPPAVVIAVAGWALLALADRVAWRRVLAGVAGVAGLVAAAGGFWLLRNVVESGSPVFPVEVGVGGLTLFDTPRDVHREMFGFTLADYLDQPAVWRRVFWPGFLDFMSWVAVVLWLVLPLAGVLAWLRRRAPGEDRDRSRSVLGCVGIAAGISLVYLVLPYTALGPPGQPILAVANARYVVPALLIGAALGAWASGRLGRLGHVLEVLALLALLDALRRNAEVALGSLALAALVVAIVAGAVWLARRSRTSWRSPRGVVAVACASLVAVAALYLQEERFTDRRYDEAAATDRWVGDNAPSGARVGVVGEGFVVYPMFGPRLENEVEYVGPVVDGMLRTYGRRAGFEAALRRGRYDLILVQDAGLVEAGLPARQERWVRGMGYRLVAAGRQEQSFGQGVRLYRAAGS